MIKTEKNIINTVSIETFIYSKILSTDSSWNICRIDFQINFFLEESPVFFEKNLWNLYAIKSLISKQFNFYLKYF